MRGITSTSQSHNTKIHGAQVLWSPAVTAGRITAERANEVGADTNASAAGQATADSIMAAVAARAGRGVCRHIQQERSISEGRQKYSQQIQPHFTDMVDSKIFTGEEMIRSYLAFIFEKKNDQQFDLWMWSPCQ